jgi:hypothetical protein
VFAQTIREAFIKPGLRRGRAGSAYRLSPRAVRTGRPLMFLYLRIRSSHENVVKISRVFYVSGAPAVCCKHC